MSAPELPPVAISVPAYLVPDVIDAFEREARSIDVDLPGAGQAARRLRAAMLAAMAARLRKDAKGGA